MEIDKSKFVDTRGHPLTQSLFLENGYITDRAIYTLKMTDHTFKGKVYPSLGRLFIEMEDVIEYDFANKYLLGWSHWKRLYENNLLTEHIDSWREELQLKLRSMAFKSILDATASEQSFQASKWLMEKGWMPKSAGRPPTKEKEKEAEFQRQLAHDYKPDIERLTLIQGKK